MTVLETSLKVGRKAYDSDVPRAVFLLQQTLTLFFQRSTLKNALLVSVDSQPLPDP
jgi:hypothetical protein